MALQSFPDFLRTHYEIHEWRHASAILMADFPEQFADICDVLSRFRLRKSNLVVAGGRKSRIAEWIDKEFYKQGWVEKGFETSISVDNIQIESPTHAVDCYKDNVAIEIEWNNKDPFFDRDLNNFRLLFDLRAISLGIIITRCDELQDIFNEIGRGSSFGSSTTHMSKLLPRIQGGGGAGCPIIVFGIKKELYVEDC